MLCAGIIGHIICAPCVVGVNVDKGREVWRNGLNVSFFSFCFWLDNNSRLQIRSVIQHICELLCFLPTGKIKILEKERGGEVCTCGDLTCKSRSPWCKSRHERGGVVHGGIRDSSGRKVVFLLIQQRSGFMPVTHTHMYVYKGGRKSALWVRGWPAYKSALWVRGWQTSLKVKSRMGKKRKKKGEGCFVETWHARARATCKSQGPCCHEPPQYWILLLGWIS